MEQRGGCSCSSGRGRQSESSAFRSCARRSLPLPFAATKGGGPPSAEPLLDSPSVLGVCRQQDDDPGVAVVSTNQPARSPSPASHARQSRHRPRQAQELLLGLAVGGRDPLRDMTRERQQQTRMQQRDGGAVGPADEKVPRCVHRLRRVTDVSARRFRRDAVGNRSRP